MMTHDRNRLPSQLGPPPWEPAQGEPSVRTKNGPERPTDQPSELGIPNLALLYRGRRAESFSLFGFDLNLD